MSKPSLVSSKLGCHHRQVLIFLVSSDKADKKTFSHTVLGKYQHSEQLYFTRIRTTRFDLWKEQLFTVSNEAIRGYVKAAIDAEYQNYQMETNSLKSFHL